MHNNFRVSKEITFVICIAVLIFIREYFISIKAGLHVDESLSIILSSYKSIGFDSFGDGFIGKTGNEIRNSMYITHGGILDAIKDIGSLWVNNRDLPHSNLYYSFLRLWMTPLSESGISNIVVWLAQMNIIFMCISFYFCVKLVYKIIGEVNPSIICAFIGYTSYFAISNTSFLRPYQFQEMMFVIYAYYTLCVFDATNIKYSELTKYAFITGVTFLTGYFSVFFIVPMSLLILSNHKRICGEKTIKKIALYLFSAIAFSFIIYPRYFNVNYRTTEAVGKIFSFKENIHASFQVFLDISHSFPLITIAAFIGIVSSIYLAIRGCRNNLFSLWIIISSVLFIMASMYFAPYKLARYAYPSLPMYAIIFSSLYIFSRKINQSAAFIILVAISACSIYENANKYKVENLFLTSSYDCQNVHNDSTLIIVKDAFKFNTIASCIDNERKYTAIPLSSYEAGFDYSHYNNVLSDSKIVIHGYTLSRNVVPGISSYFDVYKKE